LVCSEGDRLIIFSVRTVANKPGSVEYTFLEGKFGDFAPWEDVKATLTKVAA
jgi:hypothetical protein